jgi:hypothetical protein
MWHNNRLFQYYFFSCIFGSRNMTVGSDGGLAYFNSNNAGSAQTAGCFSAHFNKLKQTMTTAVAFQRLAIFNSLKQAHNRRNERNNFNRF